MTKTKPVPKSEVAISNVFPDDGTIYLWATNDAISEFAEFGVVSRFMTVDSKYFIVVDPRFDFDEVVDYIRSYGKDDE